MILLHLLLTLSGVGCTVEQSFETKTAAVGENVALICRCGPLDTVFWIRPVSGKLPEVYKTFSSASFDPRIRSTEESGAFVLRITKATQRDTGVYYCVKTEKQNLTLLKGVDLKVQGSEPDTTAVPPSDPVRPGDSVTLQCSVLSDSETKTCPGGHSVCCLKDGSDVDSSFNYIQENPEGLSTEKCTYGFFRNVSSSDAATCCCAVATCVETVCDTRPKPDSEVKKLKKQSCGCCTAAVALQTNPAAASVDHQSQQTSDDSLVYSAPTFSGRKSSRADRREAKAAEEEEEECIYTNVKAVELD
ncbi:uncharacterized protein LOC119007092 isoform X7 [Acanthopagrus latus]|uniref:uncharacterized protein LOC119007092 isoform X7 n=1 Tax=Acanthopagrus latus TaxID=8177 RepID=UPI00187C29EC|nr:uncharacterized protein LOC119007092 isoform X7 [Acanthopagrus latus]